MTPEAFQDALQERGLTRQVDAAAALQTTQGTISRWLTGIQPIPRIVEVALRGIPSATVRSKSRTSPNGSKAKTARK